MKEKKFSKVTIKETKETKKVPIGSDLKPEVSDELIEKWQSLLDLTARIIDVPSASIIKLHEDYVEVFLNNQTAENPFNAGEKAELIYGFFCETVIGKQDKLLVPDARKNPIWKDNLEVDLNMISYLGFPVNYPDGEVFGTVCVHDNKENNYSEVYKDLMDKMRQHIETDLELLVSNQHLKELNATKDKFFSIIGHDLKNPFNTLLGMSSLLINNADQYSPEKVRRFAQQMHDTSKNAYNLLENLLKWAKVQRGELEPDLKEVDPAGVIREVIELTEPLANSKDINLQTATKGNHTVLADREMLKTTLRNLVTNALKYTYSGGTVIISTQKSEGYLQFTVSDTGMGIPPEYLDRLFEIDCKLSKEGTGKEKGTGLGLILCKEFVEKQGGEIWVDSEPGKGSEFHFAIPLMMNDETGAVNVKRV
jgi:signal transduction histidine kinase